MTVATEVPDTSGVDRHSYLFGHHINNSMSPLLHQTVYDGLGLNWSMFLLDSLDLDLFLKLRQDPKCYGSAVTMPFKVSMLKHVDGLTHEGEAVGAINTIFFEEEPTTGKRLFIGTNTDVIGIRDSFYQNVSDPDSSFHGRPAVVVGGGGAARSAVYALHTWMKASKIYIVNRDRVEVRAVIEECTKRGYGDKLVDVATLQEAEQLEGAGAIVSCVPNFPPKSPEEIEARKVFECFLAKPHKGLILEMCYHPSPYTEIGELSEKAGWQVILGTEAMIYQGFEQDRYWTGKGINEMPVDKAQQAIAAKLAEASRP